MILHCENDSEIPLPKKGNNGRKLNADSFLLARKHSRMVKTPIVTSVEECEEHVGTMKDSEDQKFITDNISDTDGHLPGTQVTRVTEQL